MTDTCCCPPEAGSAVCDLPAQNFQRPARAANACPECGKTGKPVQGQTVKALLSVSLRDVRAASPETRAAIVDDINTGINAGQCACDLRNPQGSCCLGNVRGLAKQLERLAVGVAR